MRGLALPERRIDPVEPGDARVRTGAPNCPFGDWSLTDGRFYRARM